jgi:AraC family transcriptional regulator
MVKKLPPGSYFGHTVRSDAVAGITVLEAAYVPGRSLPRHAHAAAFLDLVVAGACEETIGEQARTRGTRTRGAGTCAFHPAGEVHTSCWAGPAPRCFHIEVAPALLDRLRQYSPGFEHPAHFPGGVPTLLATRVYQEFRNPDELFALAIEGLTLELLTACARGVPRSADRRPPAWLHAVCDLLQARCCEPLTLGTIAASAGVHPAHLSRVFRRFHGCTLGEHVRKLRIAFASRQLTTSDSSLAEIALAAGFADQSHFSNTFKRHTGLSPAAFRTLARPRHLDARESSYRPRLP